MRHQSPPGLIFRPVRTRVLKELLVQAQWAKVVSIVAPVGYGKTVLMSELYAHLRDVGKDCRWIGLNERHANVDRVLHALLESLSGPALALNPTQALWRGDETLEQRIDALLEVFAQLPASITVFIDNLDSCIDEALGPLLDALVFRAPDSVRFVWSTTTQPAIDIGRAKLEGRVRQIGFRELSLNAGETRDLLGAPLGARIGRSGIDTVQARTEGWPAAVRMAQIVLAASEQPLAALDTFSGSDEDIAALLNRQVLGRFSPQLRDFLMCLSQLHTFNPALCRYAIGGDTAEDHLDFLLKRNVLIVPLDRNRKRYRLHGLFREYLLGEAAASLTTARRDALLRRAAEWSEGEGEWHDAIEYALAAGEFDKAAKLVEARARVFVRESGDIRQFVAWVERLQAADARIGWDTQYWHVWALVFQRRYEHGSQQHRLLAERFADRSPTERTPDDLVQRIRHLRICIDLFTDHIDEASRGVEVWLAANTANSPYGIGSIGCIKSLCLASTFKLASAWKTMRAAQPVLLEIDGADMVGWISLIHTTLLTWEGDFARAHAELTDGLTEARRRIGQDAVLCGTMAFVGARCAVEMGLEGEARQLLALGMKTASNNVLLDMVDCGFDAAVKLWNGEDDALVSIASLRVIAGRFPPRLSLMLSCHLIRRLLRLGRLREALVEAERISLVAAKGEPGTAPQGGLAIARQRDLWCATAIDVLIATGASQRADALVAREYRIAKDEGRAGRLIELGLAKAAIALQLDDAAGAAKALAAAVSRAARRRCIRPFRDRIDVVATLVGAGKTTSWSFALAEERAFFEEICRDLPADTPANDGASATANAVVRSAMTPPTAREAELLSLLDLGLSNQQIAERTEVSVTTIKWHLKNLYRKLDVSTRTAALAKARALMLVSGAPPSGLTRPPKGGAAKAHGTS